MTDLVARIERLEKALIRATPAPLAGQQALDVATVHDHHYEGAGEPCEADTFAVPCREHRGAHKLIDEESA